MNDIETIRQGQTTLAYVVRAGATETRTSFFMGDDATFQTGFVVYPAGGSIVPHVHLPIVRSVVGTAELLLVRSGRCIVDIYDDGRALVTSRQLETGDIVILMTGGHGFRMLEDTVLLEVKQGPYGGQAEKSRFDPPSRLGE
jgi:hypothetical protein